ncbi:MAG TPA: hypothetical protein DCR40_12935 [Prolixibacteraceae bacterium]|nr:hypothetical protein [Prolixibacteraceae bacterium]
MASHTGPVAFERNKDGLPVVQIDVSFVARCYNLCDLAGLMILGPPDGTMFKIGQDYGEIIAKSISLKKLPPHLDVDIDKLNLDKATIFVSKEIADYTIGTAIQWIILHEIAHHQLKHFNRNPYNNAESREWEIAADSWAFTKLKELGYSLQPLENFIYIFTIEEEMWNLTGIGTNVEKSTHPSWMQRYENLERFNPDETPQFGNWIIILEFSTDPITGRWYGNMIAVPRNPMPGIPAQMNQFGKSFIMPVKHLGDGRIQLFGRTENNVTEMVLSKLDTYYPVINYTYINLLTKEKTTLRTNGYQIDYGSIMSEKVKGLNILIKDILQDNPISLFKGYVLEVETKPEIVNRCVKIQEELLIETDNLMINYAKGFYTLNRTIQLYQQIVEKKADEMKLCLGQDKFARMKNNMLSSSTTIWAYDKLLNY